MSDSAVKVFISYSHKDEALRDSLATHLSNLQWQGIISSWYDRQLVAGMEWDDKIKTELESADIILLLISPDFIASKYCRDIEIPMALQRHEARQAYIVPVILRPFDWFDAPFAKLQAFPKDAKPVTTWANQDEAFVSITQGIRTAAKIMLDYRKQEAEQKQLIRSQYLQKVEEVLSDGVISIVERDTLDELRETLGLSLEEAKEIETHAYEPFSRYEESLNKYKQTLDRLIAKGYYPFNEEIQKELENRQRDLGLKPEDAARISKPILEQAELDYQAKKKADALNETHSSQPEFPQPSVSAEAALQPTVQSPQARVERSTSTTPVASSAPTASASVPKSQSLSAHTRLSQPGASRPLNRRQVLKWAIPAGVGVVGVTIAGRFLGQSSQPSESSKTSPSETTVDYSKLEEFLKAGKWKEADEETNALMLKAANREKDGVLDDASIQDFPCEVLSEIDRLWVDSSGGKFGFSVQKKIYESCGGKADGEFNTAIDCFADRVGWRGTGQTAPWIDYPNVNFNTEAPHGHLPFGLGRALNYAIFWGFLRIFARTATCNL
jgi:hypothetical protein